MSFEKTKGSFKSSNGTDNIAYYIYTPVSKPRAVLQIVHGMCEYIERYEDFIAFLCANGIAVFGHDHLGHGNSAVSDEYLGYFAPKRGWQFLAKDTFRLSCMMKKKFEGVPLYILGHSMGSLVTRAVLAKHSDLYSGAIIMGTLNMKIGVNAGIALSQAVCRLKGEMARSKTMDELVFGLSNVKVENPVNEFAWISRDTEVAEAYEKDPWCNFRFTARAYTDLMYLVSYVSARDWAEKVDNSLPILICSGGDDPVGLYGRGPERVFTRLSDSGQTDIELELYSGARHEILNETNRAEVYEDILDWIERHVPVAEN